MAVTFKKLLSLLGDDRKQLPFMVTLFLFLSFADILGIALIIPVIHFVIFGEIDSNFLEFFQGYFPINEVRQLDIETICFSVIFVFLVRFLLILLTNFLISKFAQNQRLKLAKKLMQSYLDQSFLSYLARKDGDLVNKLNVMVTHYVSLTQTLLKFVSDFFVLIAIVFLLVVAHPISFLVSSIILIGLICLYQVLFKGQIYKLGRAANENVSSAMQVSQEALRGFKEIKVLGIKRLFVYKYWFHLRELARNSVMIDLHRVASKNLIEFCFVSLLMIAIILFVGDASNNSETVTVMSLYAFSAVRLLPLFSSMAQTSVMIRSCSDSIHQLDFDMNKYSDRKRVGEEAEKFKRGFESIELKEIEFSYPGQKNGLGSSKVSLKINKGDILGITGPSGVGKTTLINVILGLLPVGSGTILLNGEETKTSNFIDIFETAYLPQETFTINGSFADNISLSQNNQPVDIERLTTVIKLAKIDEVTRSLSEGVDSQIGEAGGSVSGGQRQRISIARALYRKPDFLIFDEATNALDLKVESEILDTLISTNEFRTGIIISHRTETLKHCNRIIRMDGHSVEEVFENSCTTEVKDEIPTYKK